MNHISEALKSASDTDRAFGARAYPSYNATLRALARYYGAPFVPTVEAFAALSPNSDYHGNLRSVASLLNGHALGHDVEDCTVTTFRSAATRAWGYLTGEVSFLDTVGGRKITAFRHNILYPETSRQVVVDGHMIALAVNRKLTMKEANGVLTRKLYDQVERDVQRAAKAQSLPVPAVQGTLWGYRKRTQNIKFDAQLDLFNGGTDWDRDFDPHEIRPYKTRTRDDAL